MPKKLIALVATALIVDGERKIFEPGEALPAVSPHDEGELVKGGAASDPAAEARQAKAEDREAAASAAVFEEARAAVQAEQASTEEPAEVQMTGKK